MRPGHALAEDLRKYGVALIVAGTILGFLEGQVSPVAAFYATLVGIVATVMGYWLHHRERQQEDLP